jgi:transcriptional regulator with PAS, ATPase and Fis domain
LITGETGTGKEVLARRIHRKSCRASRQFVPVNCGAMTLSLVETELFGCRKGAFTGAVSDRKGLTDEADGGVLFLDEIGEMALELQVRFLRFLDSGEVRPVGSTRTHHVDVRVIAATNRSLVDAIHQGGFRRDLFYRLAVVSLHLPPLRSRPADIIPLAAYHLDRAAARNRRGMPVLSAAVTDLLLQYSWPGNIRELQNAMEHALINCADGIIVPKDLPATFRSAAQAGAAGSEHRMQSGELTAAIERYGGNHRKAARALGISRTTLWRRLKNSRITPSESDEGRGADHDRDQ